jgi:hypothetical protein
MDAVSSDGLLWWLRGVVPGVAVVVVVVVAVVVVVIVAR